VRVYLRRDDAELRGAGTRAPALLRKVARAPTRGRPGRSLRSQEQACRYPTGVQRTFRNASYPILGAFAALVLISTGLVSAIGTHDAGPLRRVVTVIVAAGVAYIPYRVYVRPRLVARADGLTIVNPIRTVQVRWEEVEGFDIQRAILRVKKVDGTVIHVWAVQPASVRDLVSRGRRAHMILAELKSLLKDARAKEA